MDLFCFSNKDEMSADADLPETIRQIKIAALLWLQRTLIRSRNETHLWALPDTARGRMTGGTSSPFKSDLKFVCSESSWGSSWASRRRVSDSKACSFCHTFKTSSAILSNSLESFYKISTWCHTCKCLSRCIVNLLTEARRRMRYYLMSDMSIIPPSHFPHFICGYLP